MDAKTVEKERLVTKQRLMQERERKCDRCRVKPATEMHEMVSRSKTFRHSPARALCYSDEVVVLLCHDCHAEIHDSNPKIQVELWHRLFEIYGRQRVMLKVNEIVNAMKSHLYVELPE